MGWSLSKEDSAVFKGIAIVAMLFHHLYCSIPGWAEPYDGLLFWLGGLGKVCVGMFLFISGYGSSASYCRETGDKAMTAIKFVVRRLVSFYFNYWIIFLIFVPITVICFNRSFFDAYGVERVGSAIKCMFLDVLGIQNPPYNATWWFNRLIIVMYLLFPILYWCTMKNKVITFITSILWMMLFKLDFLCDGLHVYQFLFIMGILWHKLNDVNTNNIVRANSNRTKYGNCTRIAEALDRDSCLFAIVSVTFLLATIVCRMYPTIPHFSSTRMDAFVSIGVVLVILSLIKRSRMLTSILAFCGNHSANIYLIHSFYIYWSLTWLQSGAIMRSGINFIVLLIMSLTASILIEYLKDKLGIPKLIKTIKLRLT